MTGYFRQNAPQAPREPGADSHGPRQRGRGGRSGHAPSSDPRELAPMLHASDDGLAGEDPSFSATQRDNDRPAVFHAPGEAPMNSPMNAPVSAPVSAQLDVPEERTVGGYFRQQPRTTEPPAMETRTMERPAQEQPTETPKPLPPATSARGRARSRKPVTPPVEAAAPVAATAAPGPHDALSSSARATSAAPMASAESEPESPKKAPARPRRPRKPVQDTGAD